MMQKTLTIYGLSIPVYSLDGRTWTGQISDLDAWRIRQEKERVDCREVFSLVMNDKERRFEYGD